MELTAVRQKIGSLGWRSALREVALVGAVYLAYALTRGKLGIIQAIKVGAFSSKAEIGAYLMSIT